MFSRAMAQQSVMRHLVGIRSLIYTTCSRTELGVPNLGVTLAEFSKRRSGPSLVVRCSISSRKLEEEQVDEALCEYA